MNDILLRAKYLLKRWELCDEYDKFDFINTAFIRMQGKVYNSLDHFLGSLHNTIKFIILEELKKTHKTISYSGNEFTMPILINYEPIEDIEQSLILKCIEEERNLDYKKILLLAAQGNPYEIIAKELGIKKETICYKHYQAKKRLQKRLDLHGIFVKNEQYARRVITYDEYLYNDFPIGKCSYYEIIKFVLKKNEKGLSRNDFIHIIAKNKGMLCCNCKTPFSITIKGMVESNEVLFKDDIYTLASL